MSDDVDFLFGLPYTKDRLLVAASPVLDPPYSPRTVWYSYFADDSQQPWGHYITEWWAVAAVAHTAEARIDNDWPLVGMSNEGHITLTYTNFNEDEKIAGAGVSSEGASGWGYMSALKQIGENLYACGGAGQVYRRRGPGDWVHMDDGILQAPDVSERLLPRAIDGPHESAIYLLGGVSASGLPPFLRYWDGKVWHALPLPAVAERLTGIHVESAQRIWLCGANGTLLLGNAADGFKSLSTVDDNQLFYSVCMHGGIVYLGSNVGLFAYDPRAHANGIQPVITGLQPELQDANVVDTADGVLWSIGGKDIARFDGTRWQRIHHPDNPRIGP